jgi:hypothetical protein
MKPGNIMSKSRGALLRNKIILRYVDGMVEKGTTDDFFPNKDFFHFKDKDNDEYKEIVMKDLKAVFFVKSFEGDPEHKERVDIERVGLGRKMVVQFKDGERLYGYTQGFSRDRAGFIFFLCDPTSNNDKAFIVAAATDKVNFEN